jgi:hypothetical protein
MSFKKITFVFISFDGPSFVVTKAFPSSSANMLQDVSKLLFDMIQKVCDSDINDMVQSVVTLNI